MLKNKYFTLIELLVVIAIIGILASILFPALSQARTRTIEAVCKNNLKQIYIGFTNYAGENDSYVPRATTQGDKHWPYKIYPHMSEDGFPNRALKQFMANSTYTKVMYSPIITDRRGKIAEDGMGRSDYGLNKYFKGEHKRIDTQPGEIEPMMAPIQYPSNPELKFTSLKDHRKAAAYWYVNDTKTPGLYIDGSVRMFSIAEGSNFNSKIEHKQKLE
ncbi:MAG: type II secretion system GspH family protein [Lentisphaerales bacterium]|nr:type II secretion system GspH family protein [Lentisphaerales bacterium]